MVLFEDFIGELKVRNDIGEVIAEYVNLQRKGKNLMGLCPFHSERTSSFCVYPSNGSFYCFGCGAGGDVITFLRLIEHYDYIEAVKKLADRAGMDLEISKEDNEVHNKKLLMYKLNRQAAKFYHECLMSPGGTKALNYLKGRGVSLSFIKRFGLGYSPDSKYALVDFLKKKSYNVEDAAEANLVFMSHGSRASDRFYGRLMFPIIDIRGNVIAFGARALNKELPKYINTSDTLIFKKSSNLFALNFAKNSGNGSLILAEGYMDVVALHQAGFSNAVAALGTALTSYQVKLISRYTNEVILSYDADEAGQKAAVRAMTLLRENGIGVKVLDIPKAKDPDEYIKSYGKDGPVKFKNLITNSQSDTEYKLTKIKQSCNLDKDEDKIKYLTESSKIIAQCHSAIEREVYALKISSETGINKSAVIIQINKFRAQKFKASKKKEIKNIEKLTSAINDKVNTDKHKNLRVCSAEEALISYIINNPDMANTIFLKVPPNLFITEFNKKIYECAQRLISERRSLDITNFSNQGFSFQEIGRITKMMCSYDPSLGDPQALSEYISVIKDENNKIKFKNNIESLSEVEINDYICSLKINKLKTSDEQSNKGRR